MSNDSGSHAQGIQAARLALTRMPASLRTAPPLTAAQR
jgi:hypothetical protein